MNTAMLAPVRSRVVRLSGASSPQKALVLEAGKARAPVTVGSSAAWPVIAPGVLPVHLALAWNGSTLLVGAPAGAPVLVDGVPLARDWREVSSSADIRFGSARLVVEGRADSSTRLRAPSFPKAVATLAPPAPPPELASTRLAPPLARPRPAPLPSPPAAAACEAAAPPEPPRSQAASVPVPASSPPRMPYRARLRLGLALAASLVLGGALVVRRVRPSPPETTPAPAVSAPAHPSPRTTAPAPPPPPTSAPFTAPALGPRVVRPPPRPVLGKTPARAALDAVASGDAPTALGHYEALAAAEPDNEAYVEAARLLRARNEPAHRP